MANFNLTKMAVNMYCPGNVVQLDDAGLPSLLVYIPAFRLCDVLNTTDESIHPAFIVNGVQIPGFYYSKYENVAHNGKAYSLPAEDPKVQVNFDQARECCEAKGYGWHLSTAAEWAAIALWCKKHGCIPYGNNKFGKDSRESDNKAIPSFYTNDNRPGRVATGTGPLKWSHDKTMAGIWDLNGNVLEWQGGIRLVWGELQILSNNDAADPNNPQNNASTCWKAINAADGSLVEPESKTTDEAVKSSGSTVKLDYVDGVWTFTTGIANASDKYRGCAFASVTCANAIGTSAKILLRALALLPDEGATSDEYEGDQTFWTNGSRNRRVIRGGAWNYELQAGMFFSDGVVDYPSDYIGFRAAYIPNI